ncbi:hypothetical protein [Aliikangiella coralliicola]|uniref:hypothetical protein n=1 Tax=Aliikangiella coralliicola TaxID=2592383 RepID=UPI00143E0D2A|nr:hypothetical protein [Aliikangiella coralliicola]
MGIDDNKINADELQESIPAEKEKKVWNKPLLKTFSTQNTESKDTFNPGELSDTVGAS